MLEDKKQRRQILDNAKNIPTHAPINLRRAIISKDLTEQQRRDSKKKREGMRKDREGLLPKSNENKENERHNVSPARTSQSHTFQTLKSHSVHVGMNEDVNDMSQRLLVDLYPNYKGVYDDDETVMGLLSDSVLEDQVAYITQL